MSREAAEQFIKEVRDKVGNYNEAGMRELRALVDDLERDLKTGDFGGVMMSAVGLKAVAEETLREAATSHAVQRVAKQLEEGLQKEDSNLQKED